MHGEYAPRQRFSFVVDVPFRMVQPISFAPQTTPGSTWGNQGGLSDISAGAKLAAQESEKDSITFQFLATFPSGDSSKALGTDHCTISPALLYYQNFSDRFSLESEINDSHPIGGDIQGFAADVLEFGAGPGFTAYQRDNVRIAPVIEFVGWKIVGGHWSNPQDLVTPYNGNNCASNNVQGPPCFDSANGHIINLKGGFRTSIGGHTSIYVGYGHALTNANLWYNQIFRVEYRHSF